MRSGFLMRKTQVVEVRWYLLIKTADFASFAGLHQRAAICGLPHAPGACHLKDHNVTLPTLTEGQLASRLDQLEAAFRVLGKHLAVQVSEAA